MDRDQQSPLPSPKTIKEDSRKIMDPLRKKMTSLETQRIAGVLEECILKVETVYLLPAVLSNLEKLSVEPGDQVVAALRKHQRLGEKLDALQLRNEEMEKEAWEDRRAGLQKAFCASLRNILRHLRAQPDAVQEFIRETPSMESMGLVQGLKQLQGLLIEKLLTSPEEERDRSRFVQEASLSHQNNMELVSTLEAKVAAAIKDRDAEIAKKTEVIQKLKSSLNQMKKISEDFLSRTQQDAEKQNQSDRKTSEDHCVCLQQEANQFHVQLNNLIAENREVESALQKRNYKVEMENENWIQKYDADMGEIQAELEELSSDYTEEKEELRELEERYAVLELEHSQIMEERRLAQVRKEEEEQELAIKSSAAVVIQAYWKGYKVRKVMRSKSKAKKGKKRKGKKTK